MVPVGALLFALIIGGTIIVASAIQARARDAGGRRIDYGTELEALRREVERMRADVEDAVLIGDRLTDVEERLDFAERLLVQREQAQLAEGDQ